VIAIIEDADKSKLVVKVRIKQSGNVLSINIPPTIVEMLELKQDDIVEVPFLLFNKVGEKQEEHIIHDDDYIPNGPDCIIIPWKGEKIILKKDPIIALLDNATPDLEDYRTIYLPWKGKKYGVKAISKKIVAGKNINSAQFEEWLNKMGFKTYRSFR
jgi:hypothetical protein